jgi:hypothetical protein
MFQCAKVIILIHKLAFFGRKYEKFIITSII